MSSTTLALKRQAFTAKHEPKTILERFHFAALPWRSLLIVTAVALGLAYIVLVNQSATNGFALKTLEDKVTELSDANRKLEIQATELQSMQTIAAASDSMDLEPVKNVRYLGTGTAVAVR
jgi:hypothetical protein